MVTALERMFAYPRDTLATVPSRLAAADLEKAGQQLDVAPPTHRPADVCEFDPRITNRVVEARGHDRRRSASSRSSGSAESTACELCSLSNVSFVARTLYAR